MIWLRKILEKIFLKNKRKLLEEPKVSSLLKDNKNDFLLDLKKQAEVEQDEGNGYKIIRNIRLKDMV